MSNPYYIPRDNTRFAEALSLLKLGLDAYGQYSQNENLERRNNLTEQELGMRGTEAAATAANRAAELDIHKQTLGETTRANDLNENKAPAHQQKFKMTKASAAQLGLTNVGIPKTDPLVLSLGEMGKPTSGVTNGAALDELLRVYPDYRDAYAQVVSDDYANKLFEKPNYKNTVEGKRQLAFVEALESDPTGEKVIGRYFPETIQSRKVEAAKAAKEAYIPPERPVSVSQGGTLINPTTGTTWTAPSKPEAPRSVAPGGALVGPDGNVIYTNPNRPESNRPVSVPEGGTLINPQTGTVIYTAPKTAKELTPNEKRMSDKDITETESLILGKDSKGKPNAQDPAVVPHVDNFNRNAKTPYAYVVEQVKGTIWGTNQEVKKLKLPVIKGKQVTAKDVYDTAAQRGMTYDDVLKAIGALK